MNEKQLLSVSFIFSLIGIFVILLISYVSNAKLYDIADLTKDNLDEIVRIKGNVNYFTETPGLYIINLKDDSGSIAVIVFKEDEIYFQEGMFADVTGSVVEYGDDLEIIAKEIVL